MAAYGIVVYCDIDAGSVWAGVRHRMERWQCVRGASDRSVDDKEDGGKQGHGGHDRHVDVL